MRKHITVSCRGLSPLLMHPIVHNDQRMKIVELSEKGIDALIIRDGKGKVAIPAPWFRRALELTGSNSLYRLVSRKAIQASISIVREFIPLVGTGGNELVMSTYDHLRHLHPGSKKMGRVLCPQFNEWECDVEIAFESPLIPLELLQRMVGIAGREIGIGLFTPFSKGMFGTFEAVAWQWVEDPAGPFTLGSVARICGSLG